MAVINKWRDLWEFLPFNKSVTRQDLAAPFVSSSFPDEILNPAEPYELHPLTLTHLEELWQLDKRCFVNDEAYSRETLEYLLSAPNGVSYRAVLPNGSMIGFIIAMHEADGTGHITTIGVAPEYRRRRIAYRLLEKQEKVFRKRNASLMRLEVRTVNLGAQQLYRNAGYTITQRLNRYYANGGDGFLMIKSLV